MSFDKLPLHDAVLKTIVVDWSSAEIILSVSAFVIKGEAAVHYLLSFSSVTMFECSRFNEWGASNSILDAKASGTEFTIQMQSGDVIKIKAASYVFQSGTL
ncbi:hypothetical protein [Rheinheimera texasensis]|uniref:hypothetical protein n=1 Tax=Rheinheimera texasensis TaxID=306205 RepID=UPI0004E1E4B0|nr:hypothetical protein [Rheinheimera texasensis]